MNFSDWLRLKRSDEIVPEGGIVPDRESYFDMATEAPASSGRIVTVNSSYSAMKIASFFRCVDILSSGVASLPFEYKRYNKAEGYFVDYYDSNLYYLLTVMANPRMTAFEFIRNIIVEMVLRGNAYVIPRMYGGEPEELILCSPHSVSYDKILNQYTISDYTNNIFGVYRADQVVHLRNFSLDGGYTGSSTITYAADVLGISATANKETLSAFATGGRLKGLVSNDNSVAKGFGELQDNQLKTAAKILDQAIKSGDDIISVPGDAKFSTMSISQKDMELLASKEFGVLEICRFLGVHPDKVFVGQSANYKASEMSQVSFLTDTLSPILRKIESEFLAKLIVREYYRYYKFEFDKSSIYTTDLATEGAYMNTTISNGVMKPNDWRRKKGLKPDPDGETTFISCNLAPINSPKISGETESAANFQSNNSNEKDNGKKA
ncbi:phage portal protein [Parabacteroides sp.]